MEADDDDGVSPYVVRAFARLRELLASNKELQRRREGKLDARDRAMVGVLDAIRRPIRSGRRRRRRLSAELRALPETIRA